MNMNELLKDILECIEFVSTSVLSNLTEVIERWDRSSKSYVGIVEKINVAWRVPLDKDLLDEFPDIRNQLARKLEWLGNDQLSVLRSLIVRMFQMNEYLKIKLDRINNRLNQISFEKHNELKYSVREHITWIEDCWTCLHCFYMQLDFAMISLQVLDEESAVKLVEATQQDEKDKLIIGKSKVYLQSCLSLIKFTSNFDKIKQLCS